MRDYTAFQNDARLGNQYLGNYCLFETAGSCTAALHQPCLYSYPMLQDSFCIR